MAEAGADHRWRGACGWALQPDHGLCVCGLLEAEEVRLAGGDELRELLVVVDLAHGFVVEAGGGVCESCGHCRAGRRAVDEEGALMGALDAAVFLFVVENELVAQAAGGLGEVRAGLVGVGAIGGQDPGREAERGEGGEGAWMALGPIRLPGVSRTRPRASCGCRLTRSPVCGCPVGCRRLAATSEVALCPKMPSSAPLQ